MLIETKRRTSKRQKLPWDKFVCRSCSEGLEGDRDRMHRAHPVTPSVSSQGPVQSMDAKELRCGIRRSPRSLQEEEEAQLPVRRMKNENWRRRGWGWAQSANWGFGFGSSSMPRLGLLQVRRRSGGARGKIIESARALW